MELVERLGIKKPVRLSPIISSTPGSNTPRKSPRSIIIPPRMPILTPPAVSRIRAHQQPAEISGMSGNTRKPSGQFSQKMQKPPEIRGFHHGSESPRTTRDYPGFRGIRRDAHQNAHHPPMIHADAAPTFPTIKSVRGSAALPAASVCRHGACAARGRDDQTLNTSPVGPQPCQPNSPEATAAEYNLLGMVGRRSVQDAKGRR